MKVLFGVDVGGTDIKLGAFDWKSQKLLKKWAIKTDLSNEGKQIIPDVAKEIQSYLCENTLSEADVYGIGMGIPGPVDKDGNVEVCVNLFWNNFNPAEEMRKFFPHAYIQAGNDANVAEAALLRKARIRCKQGAPVNRAARSRNRKKITRSYG